MSFDLLHSSYMWVQTSLSCGKHCQTLQTGTVSRLRFCRRSWGFEIYIRWNHCAFLEVIRFFQSVGCVRNKLQFLTVQQNQKSFLCVQDWGWMVLPHLIYGIWSSQFFGNTNQSIKERRDPLMNKCEVRSTPHTIHKNESNLIEWSMIWTMLILFPLTSNSSQSRSFVVCVWRQRRQWSRWLQREEARQWDMFPEPTELLLIGYSIKSIWTPKSKSNTLTPTTNSQTYRPREMSHVMNGNHLLCLFNITLAISVLPIVLKWCRKERKKIQVKKESQQNRSGWWI